MTLQDYHRLDSALRISATISVPVILAVLIYWVTNKSLRENFTQMAMYMACVLPFSISLELLYLQGSSDEVYCVNNAVTRAQEDGPSLCVANAAMFHFFTGAISFTWMLQAIEVYIKFSGKLKRSHQKRVLHFWNSRRGVCLRLVVTFLLPLILLIEVMYHQMFGYNGYFSFCVYREGVPIVEDMFRLGIPNVMCFIIGGYFLVPALRRIVSTLWRFVVNRRKVKAMGNRSSAKDRRSSSGNADRSPVPMVLQHYPAAAQAPAAQALAQNGSSLAPAVAGAVGTTTRANHNKQSRGAAAEQGGLVERRIGLEADREEKKLSRISRTVTNPEAVKGRGSGDSGRGTGSSSIVPPLVASGAVGVAGGGSGLLAVNRERGGDHQGQTRVANANNASTVSRALGEIVSTTAPPIMGRKKSLPSAGGSCNDGHDQEQEKKSGDGDERNHRPQEQQNGSPGADLDRGGDARGVKEGEEEVDDDDDQASEENELTWKKFAPLLRANASVLIFLLVHATVWSLLGTVLLSLSVLEDQFLQTYADWTECVFNNYKNENPDAWMDVCGELSPDFGFKNPLLACYVAAGLYGALVCLMHFSSLVTSLTRSTRLHIITLSSFFGTCGESVYDCFMMEDRRRGRAGGRSGPLSVVPVPQSAAYDNRFLSESGY
jgi:hypothetical protein